MTCLLVVAFNNIINYTLL